MFRPAAKVGSTKYGGGHIHTHLEKSPGLGAEEWTQLEDIYSHGLAKKTWSNYRTAERLLANCCKEKNIKLELPVTEGTLLIFIHWLLFKRKAKVGTIRNYLAGIRQLHIMKGAPYSESRTSRISMLLTGIKNREMADKRRAGVEQRKPITTDTLRILKARIAGSDMPGVDQRLVWTVSSILFHGAFRIHELLSKTELTFDPAYTLLEQDIKLVEGRPGEESAVLQLQLKNPKENKKNSTVIVDVYETGSDLCPVRAFKKWSKYRLQDPDLPVFRFSNGIPLTGGRFNKILRERLKGHVEGAETMFSSHSFRSGAASMMGTLGFSDNEVKAVGRWSSRAFLDYIKLPRTNRIEVAKVWKNSGPHSRPQK